MEEKKSGSWFSGFWGSSKKSKKEEDKSGKAFILRSSYKYIPQSAESHACMD